MDINTELIRKQFPNAEPGGRREDYSYLGAVTMHLYDVNDPIEAPDDLRFPEFQKFVFVLYYFNPPLRDLPKGSVIRALYKMFEHLEEDRVDTWWREMEVLFEWEPGKRLPGHGIVERHDYEDSDKL